VAAYWRLFFSLYSRHANYGALSPLHTTDWPRRNRTNVAASSVLPSLVSVRSQSSLFKAMCGSIITFVSIDLPCIVGKLE